MHLPRSVDLPAGAFGQRTPMATAAAYRALMEAERVVKDDFPFGRLPLLEGQWLVIGAKDHLAGIGLNQ